MNTNQFEHPSLFDEVESDEEKKGRIKAEKNEEKRRELLDAVAKRHFDKRDARVAYVLAQFPETRNSDITLQIQYWKLFQSERVPSDVVSLQSLYELERLTTLARIRATIQNDYKLYLPNKEGVARKRKQLKDDYRAKYKPVEKSIPPISIYADESGKNEKHLVVGSAWILIPMAEYTLYRAMTEWKDENGFNQELRFNNVSKTSRGKYLEFIQRFIVNEGTLGFKAIAMKSSGIADKGQAFADLFYFLVRRGIVHEDKTARAPLPRRISFVKDSEAEGYDDRLLAHFTDRIEGASKTVFNNELFLDSATSDDSKSSIFLQVADLFTGCVNRVLNEPAPEKGWKDDFAVEVLRMLGMKNGLGETDVLNDRVVQLALSSPTFKS